MLMTNEEVLEKFRKQKKLKKFILANTQKDPDYEEDLSSNLEESSFSAPSIDNVPTEPDPQSNAGRDTCYWCGKQTRMT
jgi:hypothetical protein